MNKILVLLLALAFFSLELTAQNPGYWQQFQQGYVQPGWKRVKKLGGRGWKWVKEHPKTTAAGVIGAGLAIGAPITYLNKKVRDAEEKFESQYSKKNWYRPWMKAAAGRISVYGLAKFVKAIESRSGSKRGYDVALEIYKDNDLRNALAEVSGIDSEQLKGEAFEQITRTKFNMGELERAFLAVENI